MPRLFVDMDGVLAVFKPVDTLETLYQEGYFRNLKPQQNVVDAIKMLASDYENIDVYILSSVLTDSAYAIGEKNQWLEEYLPEIPATHRIFAPCGDGKREHVPGGTGLDDFLLDDYTLNLKDFDPPGKGLKLLNGINHTRGSWDGACVNHEREPEDIKNAIVDAMLRGILIRDVPPQKKERGR